MSQSVRESLAAAARRLEPVSDAPAQEAIRLHAAALAVAEESWLFAHSEMPMPSAASQQLTEWLVRRDTGEPLAYVLGEWEFYGRPFTVSPAVLVPRPATELLVERALAAIKRLASQRQRPLVVADIGTGSGCIGITLILEAAAQQLAHVIATDISAAALAVAAHNARRHGVAARIEWRQGSLLKPLQERPDLVVSNPPYVPTPELAQAGRHRDSHGLLFEPAFALDGGPTGRLYVDQLAATGVPAVLESVGGTIEVHNLTPA